MITNLSPNPNASVSANGWAPGAIRDNTRAHSGSWSIQLPGTPVYQAVTGLNPNSTYTASSWVWVPSSVTGLVTPRVGSTSPLTAHDGDAIVARDQWIRVSMTFPTSATVGATLAFYAAYVHSPATGTVWVDDIMVTEGTTLYNYFDGSTTDSLHVYAWTGTANGSASTQKAAAVRYNGIPKKFYIGSTAVSKIYQGTTLVSE